MSTVKVNTIQDSSGSVDLLNYANGSATGIAVNSGRKNLIINGAMQVAQRGTSFSLSADAYTLDRWTSSSLGGVSLSVSQQAATSSDNAYFASKNFLRYTRNNAVLSALVHKVEDLQQFNNKTFTLSFWAKSPDITNTLTPTFYTLNDGSSYNQYYSSVVDVSDPALSSTWQKYIYRITFQDMYSYGFSGSHHLRIQFNDSSAAGTVDIAEVQLEVGSVATPFEHRSYGEELALCQRYYQKIGGVAKSPIGFGINNATTSTRATYIKYHAVMRTSPSASIEGTLISTDRIGYEVDISSILGSEIGDGSATISFTHAAGGTNKYPEQVAVKASTTSYLVLDAEL